MEATVILHSKHGAPADVLASSTYILPDLGPKDVLIKVQYAAINPADINMIEGNYYIQPELPCVLGNEGVGVVEKVGEGVTSFKAGDIVIKPFNDREKWIGWWTEAFVADDSSLILVPEGISLKQAAMMTINPVTAFQLLTRFVDLEEGDHVLQNAANSGVGLWVIRLAKQMGLKTINLVRSDNARDTVDALGSDHTLLMAHDVDKVIKSLSGEIELALNAVGGLSAKVLAKSLASEGVMVTYGAMAKEPITLGNALYIYNTIWTTGFNRTKWVQEASPEEVRLAYQDVFNLYLKDPFEIPVAATFAIDKVSDAIHTAMKGGRSGKVLLSFV